MPIVTATRPLATHARATATNVAQLRRALRTWLLGVLDDDPDAVEDLVLAASEALENAADHAYSDATRAGTMSLSAEAERDRITIVVSDDGRWRPPDPDAGYRGRGIDLMNRLADSSKVRTGSGGTSVVLVHHRTRGKG